MKIQRRFSKPGIDPLDEVRFERRESIIREPDGTVVFEMRDLEVPADWSQVATDILAQKYFRKAGVPQPDGSLGRETSARQVVRRLAGCWTDWGRRYKYFDTDEDAAAFDAELSHMLIHQMAAPNSPQWFNTGLAYAYGINGPAQGHYYVDPDTKELVRAKDSYTHPQPHACLPGRAIVDTPAGPLSIGEIVDKNLVGLEVFDKDGVTAVIAVANNGIKQVLRVNLELGKYIEATADHLVLVADPTKGSSWKAVGQLQKGEKLYRRFDAEVVRVLHILDAQRLDTPIALSVVPAMRDAANQRLATLGKPTLVEVKVLSVEAVSEEVVYDIETASHSFLTNSVVVHNCFIQSVDDDLVNDNGIMDLWVREARLFKYGSGCVSARSFVPIVGRGMVRIGDLFQEVSRHRPIMNFDGKGRFVNVKDLGLRTISLDKHTGRLVEDPIDLVWSYDVAQEDKVTVKFDTGARATVSAWHPFMVWDGRQIVERRADQLISGDAVLGPNSSARRLIDKNASDDTLTYDAPWFHTAKTLKVTPDTDLAWLVGYFLGDGNLGYRDQRIRRTNREYSYRSLRLRFFDEDREPLERVARILRERFGAGSSISRDGRNSKGLSLTCTKASATAFFAAAVHAPGAKGATLQVPDFVRTGDAELQLAFLAGLVDSDGSVSRGKALYSSECRSFVEEVSAMASLLGLGGGLIDGSCVWATTIVRRSTTARRAHALAKYLVTPKHVIALQDATRASRRRLCMPLDADLGEKIFSRTDRYGLHGFSAGERFHVGRLVYEGIINPAKIEAAIAAKPEQEIDSETELVRFAAEGIAFVTEIGPCVQNVAFNDLTTRNTNTYLAGEHGFVVIHNTGTNFSNLRAEGEKLSGGGTSSGLMSFLRVGDRAAGAIKSGGTTRRAAKMVILDADHPDIEKFINWKVEEEKKVAALIAAGYSSSYEGDAYSTVSGQNSNNSVRISDKFIDAVRNDGTWDLLWRRDKSVARTVRARDLWDQIARAAWACADPGIQYDDIINSWHTCPAGGRIRASNPCSEYMFLDDTACNLASINLMKFYDAERGQFDVDAFRHACRLWAIVLEISVLMAQFPSPEIARKSYEYRTLGLGYANLGTLLMVSGIPYDSPRSLAITGAISAILTGESYATSAEMAGEIGPFPRYKENAEQMLRVMRNHRRAAYNASGSEYEDVSVVPMGIDQALCPPYLLSAARECWDTAVELGEQHGYRNAQATCIAPTGTIGLLMDCDTTGIEPDFALVKFKKLSGGGYFKIINQSIPMALRNLGYGEEQIDDIVRYAKGSGSLYGAPYVNVETLRARGFTTEDIIKIEKALPTVFEIGFAFNQWTLGEDTLQRLGITAEQYNATDFDLLRQLGFSREEVDAANNYICGTMTIEGAPHLKEGHYAVFDCANKCGKLGKRFIHHMGHVRMMSAAQPFISGAISKTVNLPNEATVDEIKEAYMRSWDFGLKAIALYRDGSKLSQPLSNKSSDKAATDSDRQLALSEEFAKQLEEARKQRAEELRPDEILAAAQRILANATNTDFKRKVAQALERNRLPAKRRGWTQKAKISGHTVFLRTGEYADGTLGEIFVDLHKEGASFRSLFNCFAIAISIGLQYGVPLEEFVDKFVFTRFEPNGFVDHPNIKHCTSVVDYIFRVLGMEYLGRTYFVQVKPEDKDVDETHNDDHAHAEFEARVSAQQATEEGSSATPQPAPTAAQARAPQVTASPRAIVDPELASQLNALRSREAQMASLMGDAPLCDVCGSITRRNGACYVCDSCGRSMGCS